MKKITCFICASVLLLQAQSQSPAQPPKRDIDKVVSITNTDYDMGKISAGRPFEYNLVIKNISHDTISLLDVKVGCGCTTPKFRAGENLLPGRSTFITLGFNGGANGDFTKFADIIFSGGFSKQVKFHGFALAADSSALKTTVN